MCGTDGNEAICHYLEAAPTDAKVGETTGFAWSGNTSDSVGTGLRIGAGAANTARAVAQSSGGNTANRAVTLADSFTNTVGGTVYNDWFLPSKYELDEMYFHKTMIGGFAAGVYWSSSESNVFPAATRAWYQDFGAGEQPSSVKEGLIRVRPVRAF